MSEEGTLRHPATVQALTESGAFDITVDVVLRMPPHEYDMVGVVEEVSQAIAGIVARRRRAA